ncbi:MAG TPA: ATP-binding protein, partial [Anaerolineae bacterium]|nr:ATP-binding protein [Anaerolineae bacterium]
GRPYHVVHFDGHGVYAQAPGDGGSGGWRPSRILFADARRGKHGYLAFENPDVADNTEFISGPALGNLLAETGVPVLILNACRSAHAEAPDSQSTNSQFTNSQSTDLPTPDLHSQVRAYGSLAQEVVDAGVAGVVAMRYNVYVVTAARFVADLYGALVRGRSLGEAVSYGRKQLAAQPLRRVVAEPRSLQDWSVPVVYEVAPIRLFPKQAAAPLPTAIAQALQAPGRGLDPDLPPPPDAGFYGRDETLLALDRAFDRHNIVLLHAYAGSGKTATAAEFARWYADTGGLGEGVVLFTSFERYLPLPRVLDKLGAVFDAALQASGVHWLTLDDEARRDVALAVLRQVPVLWIWDNVEPVTGFPAGSDSAWSQAEQRALADFLRAARGTRAKFLLTSRRDERAWLGELPRRVSIPPMPMQERRQLAHALAERHGGQRGFREAVAAWEPLLVYSGGNPLTLTVLVGQALREGLRTEEQIERFVAQLRAGEAQLDDEAREGRSRSLSASLSYGFAQAFSDDERRVLALLHLFQGFVSVATLLLMGHPEAEWRLPQLADLQPAACNALLDRAAEIGLLTAHGGGYYAIHPALPWFFKSLFDEYYPAQPPNPQSTNLPTYHPAARAFVEAMGALGNYYHNEYEGGNRDVIAALRAEEANLLHARRLARRHGWWLALMKTMQGLRQLYDHTGRRAEWARLAAEIAPDFVDPATDGPRPGREAQWGLVTDYRVRLAQERRDWPAAERLQRARVDWDRQQAAPALRALERGQAPESLDGAARNAVRTLAVSLSQLGQVLREQEKPGCVEPYKEAAELLERIGDRSAAAVAAFNLGHAYMQLPALRDL